MGTVLVVGLIGGVIVGLVYLVKSFVDQAQGKPPSTGVAERYCTKHVITKSMIPGGPDHLSWVYGPHRTPGNQCDGPEHRRKSGWW